MKSGKSTTYKEIDMKLPETIKDGERRQDRSAGTTTYYAEISKEEYERVTTTPDYKKELTKAFTSQARDSIMYGYGFYGCDVVEIGGKYFFKKTIGNSCD